MDTSWNMKHETKMSMGVYGCFREGLHTWTG
jgi:hypothetical protein